MTVGGGENRRHWTLESRRPLRLRLTIRFAAVGGVQSLAPYGWPMRQQPLVANMPTVDGPIQTDNRYHVNESRPIGIVAQRSVGRGRRPPLDAHLSPRWMWFSWSESHNVRNWLGALGARRQGRWASCQKCLQIHNLDQNIANEIITHNLFGVCTLCNVNLYWDLV